MNIEFEGKPFHVGVTFEDTFLALALMNRKSTLRNGIQV
jgi:hypothetical protein